MSRPWKRQCANCGRWRPGVIEVPTTLGRMLLCRDCRKKL